MSFVAQLKKWFMVKLKVKRRLARYAPSIYAKIFYKANNGKDATRSAARSGTGEPLEVSIGMTDGMQDPTEFDMDQAVADLKRASVSTDRRSLALMISRRLMKSSEEIMPSIEHMAGKALFKIQTMGIDVSTEMHECLQMVDDLQRAANDVYERVEKLHEQQVEAIGEE
ncbi:hypothetical protein Pmar_PMAR004296 [Perkinsus marinus ATCC 50983]|uniref:Uncharacterized protein n=1 Tax=Perkinsus marinus (strain ATCC 50983 / TXsc) TaxID=423536 RepID=C5K4D9_PERM5|nr:hypothetical protein Pmar_PMAR004296 [Perkinsus marinus ATCC 50983]EER20632.1 hypothetical protein Pmar_PMAR004296 [Perkinsus marinus ATCC 50983]|eukprot:XP_002788836.1 hypothetical protein Pmar_PMAR004296 [Perkinsus marinus ATCC 50983]